MTTLPTHKLLAHNSHFCMCTIIDMGVTIIIDILFNRYLNLVSKNKLFSFNLMCQGRRLSKLLGYLMPRVWNVIVLLIMFIGNLGLNL